jgi:aconitate hydratase
VEHGVQPRDFNSFGSRRGNHEVMMRGTFGNIRLRNALAGGKEGNWTEHLPSGDITSVYEAAMRYAQEGTPLVVLAGREYGTGSSRDWAAKGTLLLGVRAVLAQSFERIHRGNLVGMGVLPLQFVEGESAESLGLTGRETFAIRGMADLRPRQVVTVEVTGEDGSGRTFRALARIDGPTELDYFRNGGILPAVLRRLYRGGGGGGGEGVPATGARGEGGGTAPSPEQPSADRTPGVPPHQPPMERRSDDLEDELAEESFPSSDPPSTGGPGA